MRCIPAALGHYHAGPAHFSSLELFWWRPRHLYTYCCAAHFMCYWHLPAIVSTHYSHTQKRFYALEIQNFLGSYGFYSRKNLYLRKKVFHHWLREQIWDGWWKMFLEKTRSKRNGHDFGQKDFGACFCGKYGIFFESAWFFFFLQKMVGEVLSSLIWTFLQHFMHCLHSRNRLFNRWENHMCAVEDRQEQIFILFTSDLFSSENKID